MRKSIFLFFLFLNLAYGYSYNEVLLKAQASIFPKIILLDKKIKNKLIEGKIVYAIIYEKGDYDTAVEVSKTVDATYNGHFNGYAYEIRLVEFSDLSSNVEASAIYVLNSDRDIKKAANIALEKGIISFSYDVNNLKEGLLFSLVLEKSTTLYLNKENLVTKKIDFFDSLLQMVKFLSKNSS